MKYSILSLLSLIIAVAFGAKAPAPKEIKPHYPEIETKRRYPEIESFGLSPSNYPWTSTYFVLFVDFGHVPKYEGLSIKDKDGFRNTHLIRKMKSELVTRKIFGECYCNIQIEDVIVNGIFYGTHYIPARMGIVLRCDF